MSQPRRHFFRFSRWVLLPVLVASCQPTGTTPPSPSALEAPQSGYRLQREAEVTLLIDPGAGTINGQSARQVLAELEEALKLDFQAADLTQADGQTRFRLVVRNLGTGLADLSLSVKGERRPIEPTDTVRLAALPGGGEAIQTLAFPNPDAITFSVTVRIDATLAPEMAPLSPPPSPSSTPVLVGYVPEGAAPTVSPSATPTPAPTATPRRSGGGGGGGGGSTATPTPTPAPSESVSPSPLPSLSPSASPTATPTPAPPAPSATPTPSGTPTPTPSPSATATPTPAPVGSVSPIPVANLGPNTVHGRVTVNGAGGSGIKISLLSTSGVATRTLTTDSQGYFSATDLPDGSYYAYYYNDSDRNKIGYWRSRTQVVDATRGAAFPSVDLYGKGMLNTPAMDARVTLPQTFTWIAQTQPVLYYRYRLHTNPGRTFTLVYQSNRISADPFTWDGAGQSLSATNRYFWGVFWDAGETGEGGNLYQAIYFNP